MSETKLLPCPFCGAVPEFDGVLVGCSNDTCAAWPAGSRPEMWNRRPASPVAGAETVDAQRLDEALKLIGEFQQRIGWLHAEHRIALRNITAEAEHACNEVSRQDDEIVALKAELAALRAAAAGGPTREAGGITQAMRDTIDDSYGRGIAEGANMDLWRGGSPKQALADLKALDAAQARHAPTMDVEPSDAAKCWMLRKIADYIKDGGGSFRCFIDAIELDYYSAYVAGGLELNNHLDFRDDEARAAEGTATMDVEKFAEMIARHYEEHACIRDGAVSRSILCDGIRKFLPASSGGSGRDAATIEADKDGAT